MYTDWWRLKAVLFKDHLMLLTLLFSTNKYRLYKLYTHYTSRFVKDIAPSEKCVIFLKKIIIIKGVGRTFMLCRLRILAWAVLVRLLIYFLSYSNVEINLFTLEIYKTGISFFPVLLMMVKHSCNFYLRMIFIDVWDSK